MSPTSDLDTPADPSPSCYDTITLRSRLLMTDGDLWSVATCLADGTVVARVWVAPLRRLRRSIVGVPLVRGLLLPVLTVASGTAVAGQHWLTSTQRRLGRFASDDHAQLAVLRSRLAGLIAILAALGGLLQVAAFAVIAVLMIAVFRDLSWWLASSAAAAVAAGGLLVAALIVRRVVGRAMDHPALHGAEHQARACANAGLPLREEHLAAFPPQTRTCECAASRRLLHRLMLGVVVVGLVGWRPDWPIAQQLLAGTIGAIAAQAVAFELDGWLTRHDPRWLGWLSRLRLHAQALVTAPPDRKHREVAAGALLLLPDTDPAQLPDDDFVLTAVITKGTAQLFLEIDTDLLPDSLASELAGMTPYDPAHNQIVQRLYSESASGTDASTDRWVYHEVQPVTPPLAIGIWLISLAIAAGVVRWTVDAVAWISPRWRLLLVGITIAIVTILYACAWVGWPSWGDNDQAADEDSPRHSGLGGSVSNEDRL